MAEWLRRLPAKPLGFPRAGSTPAGCALYATMAEWLRRWT